MDFVADRLTTVLKFRALTIVDNFTRECPSIEVDPSLTGARVAAVLEHLKQTRGVPARLKVDNGPEFVSRALDTWGLAIGQSRLRGRPIFSFSLLQFSGRPHNRLNSHYSCTSVGEEVKNV
jgi:putative transposase